MKKILLGFILLLFTGIVFTANAQRVSVRLNFPVGVHMGPVGASPYRGAVWIGPEWAWRGGRYVHTAGYWARPVRAGAVWVPGHWKYKRRGYVWIPGRWR